MDPNLESVLQACEQLYAPTPSANFPERMLAVLKPVLPSTYYSWEMLDTAELRSVSARCEDDRGPVDWSHVLAPYLAYTRQHPFAAAALGSAASQVVTRSELLEDRRWERTDFYNLVLQPLAIRDQLTLTFRGKDIFAALVFHHEKAVSERSRQILHLLAPHIRQALNASFHWDDAVQAGGRSGRFGRVVVGFDGKVEEIEPGTLALLRYHFPTEKLSDRTLPGALRPWFESAVMAMWSANEPAAMREGQMATPVGRLRLTLLTQFAARRHIVLISADGEPMTARDGQDELLARLTPREREVLGWIAEGKRNGEIAIILGSQPSTVKSQVETILRKLGAETRGAAAAVWREASG